MTYFRKIVEKVDYDKTCIVSFTDGTFYRGGIHVAEGLCSDDGDDMVFDDAEQVGNEIVPKEGSIYRYEYNHYGQKTWQQLKYRRSILLPQAIGFGNEPF